MPDTTPEPEVKPDVLPKGETKAVDNSIDLQAALEREKQARERAEIALAQDRWKKSERKRKEFEDEEPEADDKPLTKTELESVLAKDRQINQKLIQQNRIDEVSKNLAHDDPALAGLIKEIHKNRTWPITIPLEEQLEEALAIAHRKKILGERDEMARALKGKQGVNNNPASGHQDPRPGTESKLSPQDTQAIQESGLIWSAQHRRFEKKLQNGQTLVYNPTTKQIRPV